MSAPKASTLPSTGSEVNHGSLCPVCNGAGWYLKAVPIGNPEFGKLQPCECTKSVWRDRQQAAQAQKLANLHSELGALAGKTFASFDPDWVSGTEQRGRLRTALRVAQNYVEHPSGWMFLWGTPGTGKSHLAAAAANELARRGLACYYRSVPDMLDSLRAGYRAGDYDQRMEALIQVEVLVLDDLGAESPSDDNNSKLFQIINARANRPGGYTIVTSNMAPLQITDLRIRSRIIGNAGSFQAALLGDDYRLRGI